MSYAVGQGLHFLHPIFIQIAALQTGHLGLRDGETQPKVSEQARAWLHQTLVCPCFLNKIP